MIWGENSSFSEKLPFCPKKEAAGPSSSHDFSGPATFCTSGVFHWKVFHLGRDSIPETLPLDPPTSNLSSDCLCLFFSFTGAPASVGSPARGWNITSSPFGEPAGLFFGWWKKQIDRPPHYKWVGSWWVISLPHSLQHLLCCMYIYTFSNKASNKHCASLSRKLDVITLGKPWGFRSPRLYFGC